MTAANRHPKIAALVLAAGMSSRFGAPKLAVPLKGTTLVQHALLAAQDVCPGNVHLVLGHQHEVIEAAAGNLFDRKVLNKDYADGIGASIAVGVNECTGRFDAVLLLLADQVLVSGEHLHAIVRCWRESGVDIVASSYQDTRGPPILFTRATFADLIALRGDHGAKQLVDSGKFSVSSVDIPAAGIDIDTLADLDALAQH
ncbi:MAG TPA: nucleotidyltransferase family protein [Woeseiaceae bacterium]|nr:nucleotidyltransferase family protein [Woeseiaceae bacterium]